MLKIFLYAPGRDAQWLWLFFFKIILLMGLLVMLVRGVLAVLRVLAEFRRQVRLPSPSCFGNLLVILSGMLDSSRRGCTACLLASAGRILI